MVAELIVIPRSNKQQKTEFSALTSEQRKRFLSSETSDDRNP
jgi:hypothetical protein